jgi:hypothetical protein
MTAVGYASTTGDTRKVAKAGDTMTGDLVLSDSTPDTDRSAASKAFVLGAVAGGATGVASDTVEEETTFGQASAAGVSAEYARGDHTHGTPSLAGVVQTTGDQVIDGTKTFNDAIPVAPAFDPEFDNQLTRKAYVDSAVAAGGGARIRTATARVADGDATATLPAAAAWTIVQSSAGTPLKASISAVAGDRVVAHPAFMRTPGPHFLDLALLDSGGAIALYAGSRASSPLVEGNPTMYPSSAFSFYPGSVMFTVGSGHIDGSGKATVALVHKGLDTTTMKVYSTPDYPWEMRLENLGGEPS